MSLLRTALVIGAAVMLLPVDAQKQAQLSATATRAAAETATFCQRNVDTCATGRELWGLLLEKAEYGVELGARIVRAQMQGERTSSASGSHAGNDKPAHAASTSRDTYDRNYDERAPYDPLPNASASKSDRQQARRTEYSMDYPRWR